MQKSCNPWYMILSSILEFQTALGHITEKVLKRVSQVPKTVSKFLIHQQTMPTTHFTSKLQLKLPSLAIESYRHSQQSNIMENAIWHHKTKLLYFLSWLSKNHLIHISIKSIQFLNSAILPPCCIAAIRPAMFFLLESHAGFRSSPYFQSKKTLTRTPLLQC